MEIMINADHSKTQSGEEGILNRVKQFLAKSKQSQKGHLWNLLGRTREKKFVRFLRLLKFQDKLDGRKLKRCGNRIKKNKRNYAWKLLIRVLFNLSDLNRSYGHANVYIL